MRRLTSSTTPLGRLFAERLLAYVREQFQATQKPTGDGCLDASDSYSGDGRLRMDAVYFPYRSERSAHYYIFEATVATIVDDVIGTLAKLKCSTVKLEGGDAAGG